MENDNSKIIQYYSNAQILEILKTKLPENEYYKFIKNNVDKEVTTDSLEDYLENNISKNKLLELITMLDVDLYNDIISEMINRVYE